jgi:hypothetical protein
LRFSTVFTGFGAHPDINPAASANRINPANVFIIANLGFWLIFDQVNK